MVVWSSLKSSIRLLNNEFKIVPNNLRSMSGGGHHRTMEIRSSEFQYKKLKDLLHFYTMLGLIPVGLIIFFTNIYIGPAKLKPIPEGYTPKHWEYFEHPITRFFARYVYSTPQQEYEKRMHKIYVDDEKQKIRLLENKIKELMNERKDYQAFYFVPMEGKYHRITRKEADNLAEIGGFIGPKSGPH